jgi:hypothetical protein
MNLMQIKGNFMNFYYIIDRKVQFVYIMTDADYLIKYIYKK